jgi:hypothetical protein
MFYLVYMIWCVFAFGFFLFLFYLHFSMFYLVHACMLDINKYFHAVLVYL